MVQYGAEAGAKGAWSRLADLLAGAAEPAPSPAGQLAYSTIFVADQDRALAFYTKLLGFQLAGDAPQPGGHRFIAVNPPGQQQFLVLWPGTPGTSAAVKGNLPGHLILRVPDIDAAFAELKARGVPMEQAAPVKAPFASFVTVLDPDGNRIMVQQQAWRAPGA
jgi:catechol 2,3-dioxygenase-like lactoylglutathione lyase family enzyme